MGSWLSQPSWPSPTLFQWDKKTPVENFYPVLLVPPTPGGAGPGSSCRVWKMQFSDRTKQSLFHLTARLLALCSHCLSRAAPDAMCPQARLSPCTAGGPYGSWLQNHQGSGPCSVAIPRVWPLAVPKISSCALRQERNEEAGPQGQPSADLSPLTFSLPGHFFLEWWGSCRILLDLLTSPHLSH